MNNFTDRYAKLSAFDTPVVVRNNQPFLFKAGAAEVVPVDGSTDTFRFIITSNTKDRCGDIVEPSGMDATRYLTNPIVLWNHISHSEILPIGTCLGLEPSADGNSIIGVTQFHGKTELSTEVKDLVAAKILRATSIGFSPLEWAELPDENGDRWNRARRYTKWELFEYSVCNIPANPDALLQNSWVKSIGEGLQKGIITSDGAIMKHLSHLLKNGISPNVKKAIEKELIQKFSIPIIKVTKMTLTPEQITQAVAEVTASVTDAVTKHLTENYGVDAQEAADIAALCGTTCGDIYTNELSEDEAAETPTDTPAEVGADGLPVVSDAPPTGKTVKAGTKYSAETKTKVAKIFAAHNEAFKAFKAFHDEVNAAAEDKSATTETHEPEIEFSEWLKSQSSN